MDRSSRQKISKEILNLNYTLDQMDLTDIYRTCHSTEAGYTFFSSAHETLSRIDHMLGQKTSLNKFKNTEILSSIFSEHNGMKLGVGYKRIIAKFTNMWKLNNILPNKWVKEEIKKEIKYLEINENGNTT